MKKFHFALWAIICFCALQGAVQAQSDRVVIYNDYDFQGANMALTGNWNGTGGFDRNVRSIRVPAGYRVTIYAQRNYQGTRAVLNEDWNPGPGGAWTRQIRSIRVERLAVPPISPPVSPPISGSYPVVYAQVNFRGPAMAVERDFAGNRDWSGFPHLIRSIRVPQGWKLTLYTERNYRGTQTVITDDISWSPTAYWSGKARSIRVERVSAPSPSSFPVIYAQPNLQGPARAIERDFAGSRDWNGNPHRIRSIRVPAGWYLVVYDRMNFGGRSYNVSSDWTPLPGDYWYNRIRSIRVYKGAPPIQPRSN